MKARQLIDAIDEPTYAGPEDVRLARVTFIVSVDEFDDPESSRPRLHHVRVEGPFTVDVHLHPGELEQRWLNLKQRSYWEGTGSWRLWQEFAGQYQKESAGLDALSNDSFDLETQVKDVTFVDYFGEPLDMRLIAGQFVKHKLE